MELFLSADIPCGPSLHCLLLLDGCRPPHSLRGPELQPAKGHHKTAQVKQLQHVKALPQAWCCASLAGCSARDGHQLFGRGYPDLPKSCGQPGQRVSHGSQMGSQGMRMRCACWFLFKHDSNLGVQEGSYHEFLQNSSEFLQN